MDSSELDAYLAEHAPKPEFTPEELDDYLSSRQDSDQKVLDTQQDGIIQQWENGQIDLSEDEQKKLYTWKAGQGTSAGGLLGGTWGTVKGIFAGIPEIPGKVKAAAETVEKSKEEFSKEADYLRPDYKPELVPGTMRQAISKGYSGISSVGTLLADLGIGAFNLVGEIGGDQTPEDRGAALRMAGAVKRGRAASQQQLDQFLGAKEGEAPATGAISEFGGQLLPFVAAGPVLGTTKGVIPKAVDFAADKTAQVAGTAIKVGAKAVPPVGAAAAIITNPSWSGMAEAGAFLAPYLPEGVPILSGLKAKIVDVPLKVVDKFADALRKAPGGQTTMGYVRSLAEDNLTRLGEQLRFVRANISKEAKGTEFADAVTTSGERLFTTDELAEINKLKDPGIRVRYVQDLIDKQSKSLKRWRGAEAVNKVLTDGVKLGLNTFGLMAEGGALVGGISALQAPPGHEEEAGFEGAKTGVALAAPFAPMGAVGGMRQVRFKQGHEALVKLGSEGLSDHPMYDIHQAGMAEASPSARSTVDAMNGLLVPLGNPRIIMMPKDQLESSGKVDPVTGDLYVRSDSPFAAGHEFTHQFEAVIGRGAISIMPDIEQRMSDPSTSPAYKAMAKDYLGKLRKELHGKEPTGTDIKSEVLAEIGRRVLTQTPPEFFYGGERGSDILKRGVSNLVKKVAPDWYNQIQTDPVFGTPVTRGQEAGLRQQFFKVGEAAAEDRRLAPGQPVSTTAQIKVPKEVSRIAKKQGFNIEEEFLAQATQELGPDAAPADILIKAFNLKHSKPKTGKSQPTPVPPEQWTPEQAQAIHQRVEEYVRQGMPEDQAVQRVADEESPVQGKPIEAQFMPSVSDIGFYSKLEQVAEDKVPNGKSAAQKVLSTLKSGGVKDNELKLVMGDFLERNSNPSKEELLNHIRENAVQVEESQGTDLFIRDPLLRPKGQFQAKHEAHTLPGYTPGSYRELLLKLPEKTVDHPGWQVLDKNGQKLGVPFEEEGMARSLARQHGGSVEESTFKVVSQENFRGPHFGGEPNIVAHLRLAEYTDPAGNKLPVLNELQSDWAQKIRKEGVRPDDVEEWWNDEGGANESTPWRELSASEKSQAQQRYQDEVAQYAEGAPDMPFKSTDSWTSLALKRAIKYAVDNGYDKLGWTTGEQQAARYDLRKHLSEISLSGTNLEAFDLDGISVIQRTGVTKEELPGLIGKDATEKLLAAPKHGTLQTISGLDLKVGGEGMKAYYDQIVPKLAKQIGKQFGAKVGASEIVLPAKKSININGIRAIEWPDERFVVVKSNHQLLSGVTDRAHWADVSLHAMFFDTRAEAQAMVDRALMIEEPTPIKTETVHTLEITPEMAEAVKAKGQSMFMPQPNNPEAINASNPAAIRTPDGKIWTGSWHPQAYAHMTEHYPAEQLGKWANEHGENNYFETGFMTNAGEFKTPEEAQKIALDNKQMSPMDIERMQAQSRRAGLPERPLESLAFKAAQKAKPTMSEQWMPEVNIGLHVGGEEKLTPNDVIDALKGAGVNVTKFHVDRGEGREPTVVASLSRPLTRKEGDAIAEALGQSAIPQHEGGGKGTMFGRGDPDHPEWNVFNPDYFIQHNSRPLSENLAAGHTGEPHQGRTGARGIWDNLRPDERLELFEQLGSDVDEASSVGKKRYYELHPDERTKIDQHFKAAGEAQYMPQVRLKPTDEGLNPEDSGIGRNTWLSPDGKFYNAGDHRKWAKERVSLSEGETTPTERDPYRRGRTRESVGWQEQALKNAGWIRISMEKDEGSRPAYFLEGRKATPAQESALDFFKANNDAEMIITGGLDRDRFHQYMPSFVPKAMREFITPEEEAQLDSGIKNAAERLLSIWNNRPDIKKGVEYTQLGRAQKNWYDDAVQKIVDIFGPDADRFAALTASFSPNTAVEPNLEMALAMWDRWVQAGRPTDKAVLGDMVHEGIADAMARLPSRDARHSGATVYTPNVIRSLTAEDASPTKLRLSGPKVGSFHANLTTSVEMLREVTNDRHIAKYMTGNPNIDSKVYGATKKLGKSVKTPEYIATSAHLRQVAARLTEIDGQEWTPRQTQAAIWSYILLKEGRGSGAKGVETSDTPGFTARLEKYQNPF